MRQSRKKKRNAILLRVALACAVACAGLAWGQFAWALDPALDVSQYAHTAWRVRDGFTKGAIFAIAQTPDGYLWLGTEFGLVRFDGVRALPWQAPHGEQLPNDFVNVLLVSRDGTLWIGTHKGLASWKDGKLRKYPELGEANIEALVEGREGTLWIGGGRMRGGNLCAAKGESIQCYGSFETLVDDVHAIYEDHKGNIWVSAQTALWRWKPGTSEHYSLPQDAIPALSLTEDDSGAIVLCTEKGLKKLVHGKIESYALPGVAGQFQSDHFLRSSDGSLWVGSWQGLFHLHQGRTDRFKAFDDLTSDFVTTIFEDREGNIWVGTQDGLDRFRDVAAPTISHKQGLSSSAAWSVLAVPDGSIWIVTAEGLNRWAKGYVTVYRSLKTLRQNAQEPGLDVMATTTEVANSGLTGNPRSLGRDEQGRLWASTSDGVFHFENGRFFRVPGVPARFTRSIVSESDGDVWISQEAGLLRVTPDRRVKQIPWSQFGHRYGLALVPDQSQSGIWIGFVDGGLVHFQDGQVRASYSSADGLGKGGVSDISLDSHGALWAATEGGLTRIKDGHIATLTSRNGLPCDPVHWVMEDNDHALWLYKPCGLMRIAASEVDAWVNDPKRVVQFMTLGPADGVRTPVIPSGYPPMVTKSPDGRIWFLPRDGVSVLNPRHLPFNNVPPPVYIEQLTADGKAYDATRGPLPPLVRDLTIDYTALSLVVPEKVHFRFKLEGQDRDWREVVNGRQVQYSNLAPKKYRFRVTACNNSGVWNEAGTFLDFSIAPAYWQTNWFRTMCVVVALGLLFAIHRIRLSIVERHQREITLLNDRLMKAQEEERSRIAGELHDGVLQQLTFVALSLGTVKYELPSDSDQVKQEINELQDKLKDIGTDIRQLTHELHPAILEDRGLPDALSSYCEEFSKVRGIPVSYEAAANVRELSPGSALCIYRIAQEALANIAKHSKAKNVQVRLTRSDRRVRLTVSDDGIGFAPDQTGESGGLGLISMRERVRQLKGTLELDSQPGRGTTLRAEVPFREAS